MRPLIWGAVVALSLVMGHAQAADPFDDAAKLKSSLIGKPVRGAILNNDFKTVNNRFVERYDADGTFVGVFLEGGTGSYGGTYSIKKVSALGEGMCFDFKDGQPESCFLIRVSGSVAEFFTPDGKFIAVGAIENHPATELAGIKPRN
jgi:hypothetical protein